ncbi:MAG: UDP-N-acetylglucosamine 2-epimerase (non-hydrolyzing) [Acidobacteriota bacterium]
MTRHRIVTVVGTRPEVIKMAPVIREIESRRELFKHTLVATAQHREMLDQALETFALKPDIDLGLMQHDQGLAEFASSSLTAVSKILRELEPDVLLIQGDTTTVMTAALAAFYLGVRVGHVEAGLRSFDRRNPFPEEINRRVASCLADIHFAPTERARLNLIREGAPQERIFVTGNTIVDALKSISIGDSFDDASLARLFSKPSRVLLVTAHRRENHGQPLRSICQALKTLVRAFEDLEIVYPVHLNPTVGAIVQEELGKTERVHLTNPLSYADTLRVMKRCFLVMTDSGGIQEEAPSFHKPVLVLREATERPELIEANAGRLVGTDLRRITETATRLLTDRSEYDRMCEAENPFGDGHAAERIVGLLAEQLGANHQSEL